MEAALQSIYRAMPVSVQNVLVTIQGVRLYSKRFGGRFQQYVDGLMRSQWLSAGDFFRLQTAALRRLLKEASREVPHYRRALAPVRDRLERFELKDLAAVPVLDRAELRRKPDEFLNRSRLRCGHDDGHTSGTSGSPLVWPIDLNSFRFSMAFVERHYRWAGVTTTQRSARFTGKLLLGRHSTAPYWRYNAARRQWLFSVYHLRDDALPAYYDALLRIRPRYIEGYPSAVLILAQWASRHHQRPSWRPRAVFVTGETLFDHQRQEIESGLGCRVFNFYGSSEGAPIICECPAGNLHLNPESGIVEFVRQDGRPARPGELAEMVVTSFRQRSLPLIRYRIGDLAVVAESQSCPCGRAMPIIERIEGRESDVLDTPDGGWVGSASLSTLLYVVPSRIAESQIEQVADRHFIFRYIPIGDPLTTSEQHRVSTELRNRLGPSSEVRLERCDRIPKSARGKARLVIGLESKERQPLA